MNSKNWILLDEFCEIVQKLYPPKRCGNFVYDGHAYTEYKTRIVYRIKSGEIVKKLIRGAIYIPVNDALECIESCFEYSDLKDLFENYVSKNDLGEKYLTHKELEKIFSMNVMKTDRTKSLLRYIFDRYYEELSDSELDTIKRIMHSDEVTIKDRKYIEEIMKIHIFPSNYARKRDAFKRRYSGE